MTIERNYDVAFIAALALREKQIQQNYRPIIQVHKWFARRPGTLFRGLLLAEFGGRPVQELFFRSNSFPGRRVADPFMGGGTPLIEANRLGCDVMGWDINPMAWWIVRQEIAQLDLSRYKRAAAALVRSLEAEIGHLYRTRCTLCGTESAEVKYYLWVKTSRCINCGSAIDLFPGYLLAENRRHPRNVLVCSGCGTLVEVEDRRQPGECPSCRRQLTTKGPAGKSSCRCGACGTKNTYPRAQDGAPAHRMFAIEYYCPTCRAHHRGRFFKTPDNDDLARISEAATRLEEIQPHFVPSEPIPAGDETDRLHRWGYRYYRDMFNPRQLLGLELSCRLIGEIADQKVRDALATNLSDLLRYQNMLCRYDTSALKSLDVFSVHGFPVGLVVCESNFLGIAKGNGTNVGSGGWSNVIQKFAAAKAYCDAPFETVVRRGAKKRVPMPGEWIGEERHAHGSTQRREVQLLAESATQAKMPENTLDAVFTDPPYFGNVQYAELMDFCYVWLRQLVKPRPAAFESPSTRNQDELTGNATMDRGLSHFTKGLAAAFSRMARALKSGAPLVFTYHHNRLDAYYPVAVAILDARLVCTATLPCPAEMGASIHISGTGSSIVDTVFVCRSSGTIARRLTVATQEAIAALVHEDLEQLRSAGMKPSRGDVRCLIYGHLVRLAVWRLRRDWRENVAIADKLRIVAQEMRSFCGLAAAEEVLGETYHDARFAHQWFAGETIGDYIGESDEVSF